MFDYLYKMPDMDLFVLLSLVFIAISIIAVFVVSWFIPVELRYKDDPVTGNVSSLISLIYGVLAGITALYLMNNISYTDDATQREANSMANIFRDSKQLREPVRTQVQKEIKTYLTAVINIEWPLMKNGKDLNVEGDGVIDRVSNILYNYKTENNTAQALVVHEMVSELKILYDAREQRVHSSYSELNIEMWVVIIIGTILTIGINFLFGMNIYLHLLTVSATSLMATSMLFLLITLDRPFQGEFAIQPDAFRLLLVTVDKQLNSHVHSVS